MSSLPIQPEINSRWLRNSDGQEREVYHIGIALEDECVYHQLPNGTDSRKTSLSDWHSEFTAAPDVPEIPDLGSVWQHKEHGALYLVYDITNKESARLEKYPVRLSYRRLKDGTTWSRSLTDWHKDYFELKFSPLKGPVRPGTAYWCPTPYGLYSGSWMDTEIEIKALRNGVVFATEAEAKLAYEAMYSPWRELAK